MAATGATTRTICGKSDERSRPQRGMSSRRPGGVGRAHARTANPESSARPDLRRRAQALTSLEEVTLVGVALVWVTRQRAMPHLRRAGLVVAVSSPA